MNRMNKNVNLGIWISEKKSQKFNWTELIECCRARGYNLIKLNLNLPLEEQGDFDILLHKLTDIIAAADQGDEKALSVVGRVQQYLSNHPNVAVVDPLDNVRILLNRPGYYKILQDDPSLRKYGIFTPTFAELTTSNPDYNLEVMRQRAVTFPVICKPSVAHGSKLAHQMILIFNRRGLEVCKPPCVVQSFVNHNAVLHKVFLIGNRYHICERPSLKNFSASETRDPIFYSTGEVCKVDSQSTLSILDPHDNADVVMTIDEDKVRRIIRVLRETIGLLLVGFDVVVENGSGDHALIDINVFPSYEQFPQLAEHLLDTMDEVLRQRHQEEAPARCFNGLVNVG